MNRLKSLSEIPEGKSDVPTVLVRMLSRNQASISWTSESPESRSWVFVNGSFVLGPFYGFK